MTAIDLLALLAERETERKRSRFEPTASMLLSAARAHGLAPLLHAALDREESGDALRWPAIADLHPDRARLHDLARELLQSCRAEALEEAKRDLANRGELRRVLSLLHAAGILPVLIKGAAISLTHYADSSLRPRDDIDFLIPVSAKEACIRTLEGAGYAGRTVFPGTFSPYQADMVRIDSGGQHFYIDAHWHISNAQMLAGALGYAELLATAVPIPQLGPFAIGPSAPHSLLIACLHRAAHLRFSSRSDRLIWLYDVHLLLTSMSPVDCAKFADAVSSKQLKGVCREGILAARAAFGTVIPVPLEAIFSTPFAREPTDRLMRGGRLTRFWGDLLSVPTLAQRSAFVRERLFPSREYMWQKYSDAGLKWLPLLYVRRLLVGIRSVSVSTRR